MQFINASRRVYRAQGPKTLACHGPGTIQLVSRLVQRLHGVQYPVRLRRSRRLSNRARRCTGRIFPKAAFRYFATGVVSAFCLANGFGTSWAGVTSASLPNKWRRRASPSAAYHPSTKGTFGDGRNTILQSMTIEYELEVKSTLNFPIFDWLCWPYFYWARSMTRNFTSHKDA